MKSTCRICQSVVNDSKKRFDPALGFVCTSCHEFLLSADKTLRRVGIEGVTLKPHRHSPTPENEKP